MAEVEARAIKLEKELEQRRSQVHFAESKYLLLLDEAQSLKQRMATGVSCDAEMEKRLVTTDKNVLGYMDVLHSKAAKFENTDSESFRGSFESLYQRFQTLLTQEVAAIFKSVEDSDSEGLTEFCGSISE